MSRPQSRDEWLLWLCGVAIAAAKKMAVVAVLAALGFAHHV
jgi:hypothetical protein